MSKQTLSIEQKASVMVEKLKKAGLPKKEIEKIQKSMNEAGGNIIKLAKILRQLERKHKDLLSNSSSNNNSNTRYPAGIRFVDFKNLIKIHNDRGGEKKNDKYLFLDKSIIHHFKEVEDFYADFKERAAEGFIRKTRKEYESGVKSLGKKGSPNLHIEINGMSFPTRISHELKIKSGATRIGCFRLKPTNNGPQIVIAVLGSKKGFHNKELSKKVFTVSGITIGNPSVNYASFFNRNNKTRSNKQVNKNSNKNARRFNR